MSRRSAGRLEPRGVGDDVGDGVMPARRAPLQREVAPRMLRRIGDQHEGCERVIVERRQLREVVVGPDIAVDHEEGCRPEHRQGAEDAATGLERDRALVAVAQTQAEARAVAERGRDRRAQPREVDDHLGDAGARQRDEVPLDERPAADLEQGLRQPVGEGPHALPAAGGEDHRPHRAGHRRSTAARARRLAAARRGAASRASQAPSSASSGRRAQASSR